MLKVNIHEVTESYIQGYIISQCFWFPVVDDKAMLRYIRNRTAAPYFSNLVWFIGNHILDLDMCVRNDAEWVPLQCNTTALISVIDQTSWNVTKMLFFNLYVLHAFGILHMWIKIFFTFKIFECIGEGYYMARVMWLFYYISLPQ